jgi:uncharacterized protein
MFKWLIFILLGYVAYLYWQRRQLPRPKPGRNGTGTKGPERMVACAHCGIHLPESESLSDDERRPYCCEEHRRLGSKRTG